MGLLTLHLTGTNLRYKSIFNNDSNNEIIEVDCISRGIDVLKINDEFVFTALGPLKLVNAGKEYTLINCVLKIHNKEFDLKNNLVPRNFDSIRNTNLDGVGLVNFHPNQHLLEVQIFQPDEVFDKTLKILSSKKINQYLFHITSVSLKNINFFEDNQEIFNDGYSKTTWKTDVNQDFMSQLLVKDFFMTLNETVEIDEFQELEEKIVNVKDVYSELVKIKKNQEYFILFILFCIMYLIFKN